MTVDFDELIPEFSGIPFLYVPGLSLGPWLMNFPLRSIRGGHSRRFGNYIYSDLGSRIRFKDEKGKLHQWGDLDLKIDYRQVRGMAGGIELNYKWDEYSGLLDSYFLHDLGRRPGSAFDAQFPPLEHPDRGKAHWFHRHELDEHWRLELEAYYLSDSSLLEEFFPKEFKEDKPPETAAYLRWLDGNFGGFLLAQVRLNRFQTQDEYLPRADFNIFALPILRSWADNIYLTERVDVVDIRRKFEEDLNQHSVDTPARRRGDGDFHAAGVPLFPGVPLRPEPPDVLRARPDGRPADAGPLDGRSPRHHPDPRHPSECLVGEGGPARAAARDRDRDALHEQFLEYRRPGGSLPVRAGGPARPVRGGVVRGPAAVPDEGRSEQPFEFATLTLGIEYYPNSLRDTTSANANNYFRRSTTSRSPPSRSGTYARRNGRMCSTISRSVLAICSRSSRPASIIPKLTPKKFGRWGSRSGRSTGSHLRSRRRGRGESPTPLRSASLGC
jgi:hypothetical protein